MDSGDEAALALVGRLQAREKRFAELAEPLSQFLDRVPDRVVEAFLDDAATGDARFAVEHSRKRRHELLDLSEENLVTALGQDGIHAWGRLYDRLAGTLVCEVEVDGEMRTMGVAQAAGLMQRPDDGLRERAWRAINTAWDAHGESCAAAINAIAGWRLEMCRKRSNGRSVHFLDAPLHMNRIVPETLDTLLSVAGEARARRAPRRAPAGEGVPQGTLRSLGPAGARAGRLRWRRRRDPLPRGARHRGGVVRRRGPGHGRVRAHDGGEALDRRHRRAHASSPAPTARASPGRATPAST